jgi:hypothetical protein
MMITHPGQALGVSLTISRGLPVLAVLSTNGMSCTAVRAACSRCGALGGASDCCVLQRRLHFTNAVPAASCCCVSCSQEISAGFFYISVGTRRYSPIIICFCPLTISCSAMGACCCSRHRKTMQTFRCDRSWMSKLETAELCRYFGQRIRLQQLQTAETARQICLLPNTCHFLPDRVRCL